MTLTYKEFIEKIKQSIEITIDENNKNNEDIENYRLENRYVISYVAGGSCWDEGDVNHYTEIPDITESDKQLNQLTILLNKFTPNLKFSEYKEIEKLIQNYTETQNEYYGNSTTYNIQSIKLKDLYLKLVNYEYM